MTEMPFGFSPVSKKKWLEQVVKERKGTAVDGLNWAIGSDISLSPFNHREDLKVLPSALVRGGDGLNSFETGIFLRVENEEASNHTAHQLLQTGTNALFFDCSIHKGAFSFEELLSGIHLEYISTHFLLPLDCVASESHKLVQFIKESNGDIDKISGSICNSRLTDMPHTEGTYRSLKEMFPGFKNIWIDGSRLYRGPKYVVDELADTVHVIFALSNQFLDTGWTWKEIVDQMKIGLVVDHDYFLSIAKIRAFKELLTCLFDRMNQDPEILPELEVYCVSSSHELTDNHWLIEMTSASMSAVIGGMDRLFYGAPMRRGFAPGDSVFTRIGQNIQQLINHESYMTSVEDPLAGSYFMENLTSSLAEKSWEKFRKRV
jgi:methylmalonyl-CoA mutase